MLSLNYSRQYLITHKKAPSFFGLLTAERTNSHRSTVIRIKAFKNVMKPMLSSNSLCAELSANFKEIAYSNTYAKNYTFTFKFMLIINKLPVDDKIH